MRFGSLLRRDTGNHKLLAFSDEGIVTPTTDDISSRQGPSVEPTSEVERILEDPSLLVSAFPPEILEEIFALVVFSPFLSIDRRNRHAFSQVCHRWRAISLNYSRLWQTIDVGSNPYLAKEFLARSGAAPIHITSQYDAPEYRLCAEDFKPHAGRIASLDIWFRDYEEIIPLVSGLASDIPSLTTFSLKNIRGLRAKLIHIQVPPLTHLRKLELHGVTIPWNSCIGNLESLSLIGIRRLSPSLSQLHTILQSSPQLRYLSLQHIQPSGRNDPRPPPVSLPHLNDFIIVSSGRIIHAILSLIVLSPTCRVQITSITTDGLTWLHPVTQNPTYDPEVTGFRLQQTSIRMLRSSAPPWSDEHTDSGIFLSAWASASHFLHQNYQSSLHCSRFTTLELDRTVLTLPAAYYLANFLLELVNLETLRVAESDSLHVLTQALSKVSRPSSRPAEHDRLICPHLRKVSFGGRDLKSVWLIDEAGSESIVALADLRRRASVPLTVIELKRLRIPREIIDRLKALVDEIHVEECGAFHLPYR